MAPKGDPDKLLPSESPDDDAVLDRQAVSTAHPTPALLLLQPRPSNGNAFEARAQLDARVASHIVHKGIELDTTKAELLYVRC